MPFFQRRQRQLSVPGLDDSPPSPARPDGAAVARERVQQIGGGIGGCVTPRRGEGGDEASPSSDGSESGSETALAPGASDEGGRLAFSTPTSMAPLSVEGSTAAAAAAAASAAAAAAAAKNGSTSSGRQASAAFADLGAGTPGGREHRHRFSWREFAYMCGPGLLMAVAYLDPGNLEADIQAGAHVGYSLLWFVALAFGCGFAFQCMTARLGIVTGRDLAAVAGEFFFGFAPPSSSGAAAERKSALLSPSSSGAAAERKSFLLSPSSSGAAAERRSFPLFKSKLTFCFLGPFPLPRFPPPPPSGDSYPRGARIVLWILLEVALVGADIQETIGSAIAIALLSGGRIPLWGGCLLITVAAFVVLLLERCGARHLEAVFGGLIAMQGLSAGVNYVQAGVPQRDVLRGLFIPKMPASAVPFAVGALGALVMPHNIYFASALASTSRPDVVPKGTAVAPAAAVSPSSSAASEGDDGGAAAAGAVPAAGAGAAAAAQAPSTPTVMRRAGSIDGDDCSTPIVAAAARASLSSAASPAAALPAAATPASAAATGTTPLRKSAHTLHTSTTTTTGLSASRTRVLLLYARLEAGIVLLGAFCINLFVVCLFAHGFYGTPQANEIGLASAGAYLGERFGALFKYLWAVGLLASGMSATITLTYAGQIVMAGLLRFEVTSWRRLLGTRAVALIPTVTIAAVFEGTGSSRRFDGMNQLLNVLQAMVLPFSLVPVIALTASPAVIPHLPFRTRGWLLAFACSVAALVAAIDGYLVVDFARELAGGGGGVGAATWAGLVFLLGSYYALIGYFAVGPVRVERWARGAAAAAARGARRVAASIKGTKWNDAGAMMEVHL